MTGRWGRSGAAVVLLASCVPAPGVSSPDGAAASGSASTEASDAGSTFPVWWSRELQLASLAQASEALRRKDPDGFGELSREGEVRAPEDCRSWAALHARGFEPMTTLEMQADGAARLRCTTLSWLTRARPARSSHVRQLSFEDPAILSALPAELATAVSPEADERLQRAMARGATLAEHDPGARVTRSSEHSFEVTEGDGASVIVVRKQALGDLDGDGLEDLVVAVVNAMAGGTLSYARLFALTRRDDASPLERLRPAGVGPAKPPPRDAP